MINSGEGYGLPKFRHQERERRLVQVMNFMRRQKFGANPAYFWATIKVVPGKVLGISL
jgi:hypothetical protein